MTEKTIALKSKIGIDVILFFLGGIIFLYGRFSTNYPLLSIGIFLFWLGNVWFSLEMIRERIVFFLFQCTFFTFLISRPIIETIITKEWWVATGQADAQLKFAFCGIAISSIGLYLGGMLISKYSYDSFRNNVKMQDNTKRFIGVLQNVSYAFFLITAIFFGVQEIEKLTYMAGKSYLDFYTGFTGKLPGLVYTIASFMKYSLCIFLATLPSKRKAFLPLALYVISAVPDLVVGRRNGIILNCMFVLTYYVIRDYLADEKKWIGKVETILLSIGVPAMFIFMDLYANIRSNIKVTEWNIIGTIIDFFDGQGVTFVVIASGHGHRLNLPQRPFRNYTFGGFIDYVVHGRIGQKLFGSIPLPDYNCVENGTLSNNLAHNLAYTREKEMYLSGQGWGSSFILENYIDFGYIGVFLFSLFLGMLLIWFVKKRTKSVLINTICLVSITTIYFIPRAEATGWATFLITLQFWACVAGCYILTWLWIKYQDYRKGKAGIEKNTTGGIIV